MFIIVFLSVTCPLCFYQSRAHKSVKQKVDNKEEVYDEPDPVSDEQISLWLIGVFVLLIYSCHRVSDKFSR